MNKDIIYIDVEDDVTSVIGKVRDSAEKIVALVPPKNIGALQSAVNLRLLQKAADNAGKRLVLITNNSGLTALAAGVKMPVAKNLQSKPEIPTAPEAGDNTDDDIIKGEDLPVGELAAATTGAAVAETSGRVEAAAAPVAAMPKPSDDDMTIDDSELPDLSAPVAVGSAAGVAKKKGPKVPNFNRFRKWIFIGGGAIVAIILFFVLTNVFLTGATVVISAQTSDQPVDLAVTLSTTASTNPDDSVVHSETKTLKKTASVDFTPTGKKNVGDKATGTVRFSSNDAGVVLGGTTIAAGTELTTGTGIVFTTDQAVTINSSNYRGTNVGITAQAQGTSSNGASGSVNGAPDGVSATIVGATGGGTDKTATVVSSDDVSAATGKLSAADADSARSALASQFGNDYVIITDSFSSQNADPVSAPAVGAEGTSAKLTRDSTYTLSAVKKSEIKTLTTDALNSDLSGKDQRIYDDGSSKATLTQFITSPSGVQTAHVKTNGKVGPNIDDNALKTQLVGKKSGEIISLIRGTNGVKDVSVHFSPFWRTTAPGADKIKISFDLQNE